VPLYHQVIRKIEAAIQRGELPHGAQLPNEFEMARQMGISRPTLRAALVDLVERGVLIRRRGIGTLVAPPGVRRSVGFTSLYEDLLRAGRSPTTRVLELRRVPATSDLSGRLQVEPGTEILELERLRFVDAEPIALMTNFLPGRVELDEPSLVAGSLYQLLRAQGVRLVFGRQKIGARPASPREGRLLDVRRGAPLLRMERTTFDETGQPVEYASHLYPAERYSLEMTVSGRLGQGPAAVD
jgi:DNA-binding GntR family transcriptional regulator